MSSLGSPWDQVEINFPVGMFYILSKKREKGYSPITFLSGIC
jgi:hypothetical protein